MMVMMMCGVDGSMSTSRMRGDDDDDDAWY